MSTPAVAQVQVDVAEQEIRDRPARVVPLEADVAQLDLRLRQHQRQGFACGVCA